MLLEKSRLRHSIFLHFNTIEGRKKVMDKLTATEQRKLHQNIIELVLL